MCGHPNDLHSLHYPNKCLTADEHTKLEINIARCAWKPLERRAERSRNVLSTAKPKDFPELMGSQSTPSSPGGRLPNKPFSEILMMSRWAYNTTAQNVST